jgi:putative transcriptional regulator
VTTTTNKRRESKRQQPTDKERLRREIVEMAESQNRLGLISNAEVDQVTLRMLGSTALPDLPKVPSMTAAEIVNVRVSAGVSQAVFGGFLNVEAQTVSMWERGARRPTGAALKLLHVVKTKGLDALR